jgi:hypothetical protein
MIRTYQRDGFNTNASNFIGTHTTGTVIALAVKDLDKFALILRNLTAQKPLIGLDHV